MIENKTQTLAYVGKKPVKRDTVAGTATIWNGYGDVQEVMHSVAVKLLQHPDVWITAADFKKRIGGTEVVSASISGLTSAAASKVDEDTGEQSDDDAGDDNSSGETEGQSTGITTEPSERHNAIKAVICGMEQGNPEHFSESTGAPLLDKVRELAGDKSIKVKDVNAAWSELKAK